MKINRSLKRSFIAHLEVTTKVITQGSHSDWKTWKNGKAFSSQGKVREF